MTMGAIIQGKRKELKLTQEMLANHLGVTNQAVSKWEQNICYPDITLLPMLAELFECTIDELFDIKSVQKVLPWADDDTLYFAAFKGHRILTKQIENEKRVHFAFQGCVQNLRVYGDLLCNRVLGNVKADGSVACDDVGGSVHTASGITCNNIKGPVSAGGSITCDAIEGDVTAGGNVQCDTIRAYTVTAGGNIFADDIQQD